MATLDEILSQSGTSVGTSAAANKGTTNPDFFFRNPSFFSPGQDKFKNILTDIGEAPDLTKIRADKLKNAQSIIDTINQSFNSVIQEERELGRRRSGRGAALSVGGGLAGSPRASAKAQGIDDQNAAIIKERELERSNAIANVMAQVEERSTAEFQSRTEIFRKQAEEGLEIETAFIEQARNNVVQMAQLGVTSEQLKTQSPEVYAGLLKETGFTEEGMDAFLKLNRPKEDVVFEQTFGDRHVRVYQDPITGEQRQDVINFADFGIELPDNDFETVLEGGNIVIRPTDSKISEAQKKLASGEMSSEEFAALFRAVPLTGIEGFEQTEEERLKNEKLREEIESTRSSRLFDEETGGFEFAGQQFDFIDPDNMQAKERADFRQTLNSIDFILQAQDLYRDAVSEANEEFGAEVGRISGAKLTTLRLAGKLPRFQAYTDFLKSNRATIAKGLRGESGNLAREEQRLAMAVFPQGFTTPEEAEISLGQVNEQVSNQLRRFTEGLGIERSLNRPDGGGEDEGAGAEDFGDDGLGVEIGGQLFTFPTIEQLNNFKKQIGL